MLNYVGKGTLGNFQKNKHKRMRKTNTGEDSSRFCMSSTRDDRKTESVQSCDDKTDQNLKNLPVDQKPKRK